MLFVTNSVKASVFVRDALSRANLQATIYRTKKAKVKKVLRFLCLPFPYKIGQEIVATTACTDPPKILFGLPTLKLKS